MENASEALVMAGEILIFIIALTVCLLSFSNLRNGIDNLVTETETIKLAKNGDEYINFIKARDNSSERVVGAETVVASMYRAAKENYIIYIKLNNNTTYKISNANDKINDLLSSGRII